MIPTPQKGAHMVLNVKPRIQKKTLESVRILTMDIETRPIEAYVWSLWKQNVGLSQVMERGHVMCFVAKWYGEKEVIFKSDFHDGHDEMIKAAWELLNECDLLVTYNGVAFDVPHLMREFALLGLNPPKPHKDVDLIKTVRKRFNFSSNKLANVVDELGIGAKMDTGGFELWKGCMDNDPKSWEKMRRYNVRDVAITERLYDRMRAWVVGHPHLSMFTGNPWACPACGNEDVSNASTGEAYANVQKYRSYSCSKCGTHIRGNRKIQDATQTRSYR